MCFALVTPWPIRLIAVAQPDDFGHVPALREAGGPDNRPAPGARSAMSMTNSGSIREGAQATAAGGASGLLKLDEFLPHRLNVLSSLVSQALTSVYGRYGIGIPEWRVLVTLGENLSLIHI